MEELALINAEEYCKAKTAYLVNVKRCSLSEIRAKLLTLGINKDIIECCIANYSGDTQTENLLHLLQTKYRTKLDQPQKLIAALMRKGFPYSDIDRAFGELEG